MRASININIININVYLMAAIRIEHESDLCEINAFSTRSFCPSVESFMRKNRNCIRTTPNFLLDLHTRLSSDVVYQKITLL